MYHKSTKAKIKEMFTENSTETAAVQETAALAEQTVANATTPTETGNTANVATMLLRKAPPKVRVQTQSEKVEKEAKRLTGNLLYIALVSHNHWRNYVNVIVNGQDKTDKMIACFRKDESAIPNLKCGGYIATTAENLDEVLGILKTYDEENMAKPLTTGPEGRSINLWQILDHFQTVEAKPRAKKATSTEATSTEATA